MPQQYDFLQLRVTQADHLVHIDQDDYTIQVSVHQLPDLIRTLQLIDAENRRESAKRILDEMKGELTGKKASIHALDGKGQGPKGAA